MLEDRKEDFELDLDLFNLRMRYVELKKDRQKGEKDADLLKNKIKMLNDEELKISKKEENDKKKQEENEKIKLALIEEKMLMENLKNEKFEEIQLKKAQISEMKEDIHSVLSSWRSNLSAKNEEERNKFNETKKELKVIIANNKKKLKQKKKALADNIKVQMLYSVEKKKKGEIDKKKKMKMELEALIIAEESKKDALEEKISTFHNKEQEIAERLYQPKVNGSKSSPGKKKVGKKPESARTSGKKISAMDRMELAQ